MTITKEYSEGGIHGSSWPQRAPRVCDALPTIGGQGLADEEPQRGERRIDTLTKGPGFLVHNRAHLIDSRSSSGPAWAGRQTPA